MLGSGSARFRCRGWVRFLRVPVHVPVQRLGEVPEGSGADTYVLPAAPGKKVKKRLLAIALEFFSLIPMLNFTRFWVFGFFRGILGFKVKIASFEQPARRIVIFVESGVRW